MVVIGLSLSFHGCSRKRGDTQGTETAKQEQLPPTSSTPTPLLNPATPTPSPSRATPVPRTDTSHNDQPDVIQRARSNVLKLLASNGESKSDIVRLQKAWGTVWVHSFDLPLPSASSPEVAKGVLIPPDVIDGVDFNVAFLVSIGKGNVDFLKGEEETEAACALALLSTMIGAKGGAEIPAFLTRAGSLPPTQGDVVVFRAMNDALMFMEHPTVLNHAQFNGWLRLATARNPVYRLIAARSFHSVSSDLAQRSAVYRRLLSDSDPAIARIAVTGASRNVTPETSTALSEFRERQNRLGNVDLAETAAKALQRLGGKKPNPLKSQ